MAHARKHSTVEAVILRSFDVGEADRFCILLTKERGRLPVRAMGARRAKSRLGPVLLPLQHVKLDLEEHAAGITVSSGIVLSETAGRSAHTLAICHEAAELVLKLTEDQEESPDLFAHCQAFFAEHRSKDALVPFAARLLSLLGILPLSTDDPRFAALSDEEQTFLFACANGRAERATIAKDAVEQFVSLIVHEHLRSPLVTTDVRLALEPISA